MPAHVRRALEEWRQNLRLRLGAMVVLCILAVHAALLLGDRRAEMTREYESSLEVLARTEEAGRQQAWTKRADEAGNAEAELRASLPPARTEGVAQAEMQAWLTRIAQAAFLEAPRVQVEPALEVPDYPELLQVLGRLEAGVPEHHLGPFLRELTKGLPWTRAETLEISGDQPARLVLVVRGYFRRDDDRSPSPLLVPAGAGTHAVAQGGKALPGARTPKPSTVAAVPAVFPVDGGPRLPEGAVGMSGATPALAGNAGDGLLLAGTGAAAPVADSPRTPARRSPTRRVEPPRLVSADAANDPAKAEAKRKRDEMRARFRARRAAGGDGQ